MVTKSLKGVRSPVPINKENNKMQVNEMATPTRKSVKKQSFHWLFKVT